MQSKFTEIFFSNGVSRALDPPVLDPLCEIRNYSIFFSIFSA